MVTGARMICRSDISKIATASCHGVCFTEWYPDRRIDRESKLFPPVPPNVYRPPFEPSLFFTAAAFFPRCARNYNKCRARNTRRRNITRLGNGVTVCRFLFFFFFCQRIFALERIHPVCIRLHRVPCSLQSSLVFDTVTRSREREREINSEARISRRRKGKGLWKCVRYVEVGEGRFSKWRASGEGVGGRSRIHECARTELHEFQPQSRRLISWHCLAPCTRSTVYQRRGSPSCIRQGNKGNTIGGEFRVTLRPFYFIVQRIDRSFSIPVFPLLKFDKKFESADRDCWLLLSFQFRLTVPSSSIFDSKFLYRNRRIDSWMDISRDCNASVELSVGNS